MQLSREAALKREPPVLDTASREPRSMCAGSGPDVDTRPRALLVFGEHVREVITTELALWLSRVLVGDVGEILTWEELAAAFAEADLPPDDLGGTLLEWGRQILEALVVQVCSCVRHCSQSE